MKVLWGPVGPYAEVKSPHEMIYFGENGSIPYQLGESWDALFSRLPAGFSPDLVIWRYPETSPWPIEDACPKPLAVILGDWSLYFSACHWALDLCDFILTDRLGIACLKLMGIEHTAYWPGYGFQPEAFHAFPDLPLLYDISFVGNLNHDIHRARARVLARIAKLSDRYRVALRCNIPWGGGYPQLLAQSRIVVNYSVRREMNMRAYEVPACGALLFMEESNWEVRDYLEPGKECVLYNDDNLEELLVRHLENEPLRAQLAAAGQRRIQSETFQEHMSRLMELLEKLDWQKLRERPRRPPALKEAERSYRYGRWLACAGPKIAVGHDELVRAIKSDHSEPEYWNAVAVVEAMAATKAHDEPERRRVFTTLAEPHFMKLLEVWPAYALGWANLGFARLEFGFTEKGVQALTQALDLLCANTEQMIFKEGCCFFVDSSLENKTDFNAFKVEWERMVVAHATDPARLSYHLAILLRWQCARRLGDALLQLGQPEKARDQYAGAITARPELEYAYFGLGRALDQLGQTALAGLAYKEGLERQPWDLEARRRLAALLSSTGDQFGSAIASFELSLLEKSLKP